MVANIERKERDAARMAEAMAEHMREFLRENVYATRRDSTPYQPTVPMQVPGWLQEIANERP